MVLLFTSYNLLYYLWLSSQYTPIPFALDITLQIAVRENFPTYLLLEVRHLAEDREAYPRSYKEIGPKTIFKDQEN